MSDLDSRCEKCERDIKQLRIELDALRSEMTEVVDRVLARVDEILGKVDTCNRADVRGSSSADRGRPRKPTGVHRRTLPGRAQG